jgi:hypothetical protein
MIVDYKHKKAWQTHGFVADTAAALLTSLLTPWGIRLSVPQGRVCELLLLVPPCFLVTARAQPQQKHLEPRSLLRTARSMTGKDSRQLQMGRRNRSTRLLEANRCRQSHMGEPL